MPNNLVVALAQNKATFDNCRLYLFDLLGKNKEKVIALENGGIDITIPYYISYIESKGIDFNEAVVFFKYSYPDYSYWELIKVSIVNTFRKMENNDLNFVPY